MAGIWSELLHVGQLRVADNFFELGGHSLLATQLISRLRTAFSLELPLRLLFDAPTVAGQARAIEEALKGGAEVTAPPLLALAERSRLPLSFAQQRLWFLDQLEPGTATYNIPIGIRLSGRLDVEALERSISEVVRRHETLRTRFVEEEGTAQQVIELAQAVVLPVIELSGLAAAEQEVEVQRLATLESRQAFDLAHGPLWRGQLLRLGAEEQVLLFTMHHIVSDGWSMNILTREVSALYEAYAAGQESPLTRVADPVCGLCSVAARVAAGRSAGRATGILAPTVSGSTGSAGVADGSSATGAAESSRGASAFPTGSGVDGRLEAVEPARRSDAVHDVAGRLAVTAGALQPAGGRGGGHSGSESHASEVEGLIGFFVNTLVLRTEVVRRVASARVAAASAGSMSGSLRTSGSAV